MLIVLENSDTVTFLICLTGRLVSFSIYRNFLVHWNLKIAPKGGTQIPTSFINKVKPSVQIIDIEEGELGKTKNNNVAETGKI